MSKIVAYWLINCAPIQVLLLDISSGQCLTKSLKMLSRIIYHFHHYLQMFEGKCLLNILKIWAQKIMR